MLFVADYSLTKIGMCKFCLREKFPYLTLSCKRILPLTGHENPKRPVPERAQKLRHCLPAGDVLLGAHRLIQVRRVGPLSTTTKGGHTNEREESVHDDDLSVSSVGP